MPVRRAVAIGAGLLTAFLAPGCNNSVTPVELTITVTAVSPANGPLAGGTRVTITGTNFIDVTSVTIGGSELGGRTVVSSTEITGTAPAATSAGARDVIVTSSSHGSATCSACFSYVSSHPFLAVVLAAGGAHTCGLTGAGTAYCWGFNDDGQLGNGTNTGPDSCSGYSCSTTAITVSGGLSFRALAAGYHTCGLTSAGTAYCWGQNDEGQLGVGTATGPGTCGIDGHACSTLPLPVTGGLDFDALATGGWHTCGLTSSGAPYCWGLNDFGQLGDGSTTNSSTPVAVSGGLSFSALASGPSRGHTCALTTAGAAYCWGANSSGQLGNGSTTNSSIPVAVSGGLSFSALATGSALGDTQSGHTCGLTSAGVAYCWGENTLGQLGNGSTTNSSTPVAVSGGLTFSTLASGRDHNCGLTSAGAAYCWGGNGLGQLGNGSTTSSSTPVAVSGGLSFTALATGEFHTCGLTSAGAAYCWGRNIFGQLGDGTTTNSSVPVPVAGLP